MATSVGIKLEMEGAAQFKANLSQINQQSKELAAQMKSVVSGENDVASKTKILSSTMSNAQSKIELLNKKYAEQEKTLNELKDKLAEAEKTYGKASPEAEKLTVAITKQETAMSKTRTEIAKAETEYNNAGKAMDDLGESAEDSGEKAEKSKEGFTVLKGVLADLAASAIKKAIEGLKEIGTAVLNLGKEALMGYADMEQLKGGVEKLFGDDMPKVLENANNAYKTAGLNANEYMETVTSFSASLISSLGGDTAKAAEYADMAISDMSDNANTFGSDMETVMSAYQGFSKGQYQLLDNLKIGYGGTRTEAERLIEDAEKMSDTFEASRDENGKLTMSYADMVEAIHIVQTNMKITGTTAKEASKTISGSISSTKSAWKNLINSLGDPSADIKKLVRNVISSAKDVVTNVLPIIQNIVDAIPEAITEIMNAVQDAKLVKTVLNAAKDIFKSLSKSLPSMIDSLMSEVAEILPDVLSTIIDVLPSVVTSLFDSIVKILDSIDLGQLVSSVFDAINSIIKSIVPRVPELLLQLVAAVIKAIPELFVGVGETIYNTFDALFGGYTKFDTFKSVIDEQTESWHEVTDGMKEAAKQAATSAGTWSEQWGLLQSITDENGNVKDGYEDLAEIITGELSEALGIEIELIDGQIQNYKDLVGAIDEAINKKRAELILQSEEEAYAEALRMRPELVKAVNDAEDNLLASEKALAEAQMWAEMNKDTENAEMYRQAVVDAEADVRSMQEALDQATQNLAENTSLQTQYMSDYAAAMEGNYDQIGRATKIYTGETKEELAQYVNDVAKQLETDKTNRDSWAKEAEATNDSYAQAQVEYYDRVIADSEKKLAKLVELAKTEGANYSAGYVEGILGGESSVKSASKTVTDGAINSMKNTQQSQSPSKVTKELGGFFGEGYANGINSTMSTVASKASAIANKATSSLKSTQSSAYTAGRNTGSGFAEGIGSMAGYVWNAASNIASSALNSIKSFLGIHSPSKEMMWVGEMLDKGLALGIEKNASLATNAVSDLTGSLMQTTAGGALMSSGSVTNNSQFTVNVYGAEGQNVSELADIVADRIQMRIERTAAVYA